MNAQPNYVESEIAFVGDEWRDQSSSPRIYSKTSRLANTRRHTVKIGDARSRHFAGELDLDVSGFVLLERETSVTKFSSKEIVLGEYFPEMREVLMQTTGAYDALPFPFYQVRSKSPQHFFDAYSLYIHCDYSPDGLDKLARHIIKENAAEKRYPASEWDYAFYNLWRPIVGTVQKDPLVVMDASTLERKDIIDYHPTPEGQKGLAAVPLFNPEQRFYYVPQMRIDEVLVLKQLDTRNNRALVAPHTSFQDPTVVGDVPERQSIDIRFMCIFPK
jgi:hypothetical protein